MIQKACKRSFTSFCYSSVVGQIIFLIAQLVTENSFVPMVPSYRAFFSSDILAVNVYFLLIGVIGAAFGAASVIFQFERWSLLKQALIHFIVTTIVWLPIATFVWGLYLYPRAIVSTVISMTITYLITWTIQYQVMKHSIREINEKLEQMEE